VTVIPSVVDESRFPLDALVRAPANDGPVTIGWIGHPDNMDNLASLRPAFEDLARRFPGRAVLKVVSSRPFDFGPGGPAVVNKPWRLDAEAADVRSFDVGLMPLADTPWNRHKCAYKALLYMSQGLPTVVTPVGVNADIIQDGVNGYHASTPEQWADRLVRLLADPPLAGRLGAAGRQTVLDQFTVAAVLPAWVAVLRGTVAGQG
jgi:glycosyltransferase involved in cell wall biosynthesis